MQAPLEVSLDPRLHPAAGDLEARLALEKQILDSINTLDHAIANAMTVASKTPSKRAAIDAEIADLVMLKMDSSEADVLFADKIRAQLGFLMNSLEGAYQKPTAAEYASFDELKGIAAAGEAKLAALTR